MTNFFSFLQAPWDRAKLMQSRLLNGSVMTFAHLCNILWTDTSFFYTAYTASAASGFGGCTIIKASGMFTTSVLGVQCMEWSGVHILTIDEISFMTKHELKILDVRLRQYRDRNKESRGYCIIFGGDFRQVIRSNVHELLYSRN
jgi:hypothetical protein